MRARLLLLSVLFLCTLSSIWCKIYRKSITRKVKVANRLWGGMKSNTGPNMGGWLIRITNADGAFACCGAYYSHHLVISSANCMEPFRWNPSGVTAEGTAFKEDETENFAEVEYVYIPDDFVAGQTKSDIALILLRMPIKGRLTEFIKLCDTPPDTGIFYNTFGWGYSSIVVQKPSTNPRTVVVPFQNKEECATKYKAGFLSDTILCVVQPKDRRDCLYDDGSPLVYKQELCGIASIGFTCQNTSTPAIYTDIMKIKNYINEIENTIRKDSKGRKMVRTLWGENNY
ncbi:seminase-like [Drosophila sulfurigaster albostrigata]|uniref:seminase-like n=1 Tax=Drosophila sulfurigaster albostrigata TaxID=89887 RepID=UPI002D219C98|nr:seminase-like [Drosophila sulfurigaster albostrigata]